MDRASAVPSVGEVVWAPQSWQTAWPVARALYFPAAQFAHVLAPVVENFPTPHSTHAPVPVAPTVALCLPAGHATHVMVVVWVDER